MWLVRNWVFFSSVIGSGMFCSNWISCYLLGLVVSMLVVLVFLVVCSSLLGMDLVLVGLL